MNLKKKIREFFTLDRNADGFTLIELIVVIAIVAILGGVAVPAYSGYIEKADRAADAQLLADVNKAFAAACMVKGVDNYNNENVQVPSITEGQLGDVTITGVDGFNDTFKTFYEGGEFKKTTKLEYVPGEGRFVDPATDGKSSGGVFAQIFNSIENIEELAALLKDSTFGDIGAEGLMEKLDTVTNLATLLAMDSTTFNNLLNSNMGNMAAALGYTPEQTSEFMEAYADMIAQVKAQNPGWNDGQAKAYIMSNYAVLQAAKNASTDGLTAEQRLNTLKGGLTVEQVKALMGNNSSVEQQQEGLSNAAMMYAMYTSYANSLPNGDAKNAALAGTTNTQKFIEIMNNQESETYKGFQSYLNGDQAKKDMDGYIAALEIIDSGVTQDKTVVSDLLVNGYKDPDLSNALNGLIG